MLEISLPDFEECVAVGVIEQEIDYNHHSTFNLSIHLSTIHIIRNGLGHQNNARFTMKRSLGTCTVLLKCSDSKELIITTLQE